jgi:hypothetical protein
MLSGQKLGMREQSVKVRKSPNEIGGYDNKHLSKTQSHSVISHDIHYSFNTIIPIVATS